MVPKQPAKKSPAVSVVIPNWNGLEFLKLVLPSLRKQTLRGFETIVVDNGSSDGSVDYIRKYHPSVDLIALHENLGFPGGVNRGLAAARGEFVALLNNDLELDRKCLAELAKALRANPKVGFVAAKMMQFKHRDRIDEVGGLASWYGVFGPRGRDERDCGQYDRPEPVFSASGGAAMYRRAALRDVGLLDEDFYAYLEDVDWSFRAQLAGWRCRYVPTAVVYHIGGATFRRVSKLRQRMWTRNTRFVILKNYPAGALLRHWPKLLFGEAKTFLGAIKDGWFGTYLHAQFGFWWQLPRLLRKRWRIQRQRRVDLNYLNTVISSRFGLPSKLFGRARRTP